MALSSPIRFAWLSIAAAITTIALKMWAYQLTGSVGLLSDALESLVNLAAAMMALAMLTIAARPADEDHAYGHYKAEYFASAVEGLLIMIAAFSIIWAAGARLLAPQPIEQPGLGLAISLVAAVINFVVARVLLRAGREHQSITLEADAQHLMTDVWTSAGVLLGIALVWFTGWNSLDPLIALLVAANIVWSGWKLVQRSALGLMDTALPPEERATVRALLDGFADHGVSYHALRTRQAAARRFVSVHLLVPDDWTVLQGHTLAEDVERAIRHALPRTTVFTHLEPSNDPTSWEDTELDRHESLTPLR